MKRCHFFWGTRNNHHKMARVAWDKVINSRDKGGLKMRDESGVKFWPNKWCAQITLADRFPCLAALEINQNFSLADHVRISDNDGVLNGRWRKRLREGQEFEEAVTNNN
ncbi:hypothetical protein OSB04_018113 [Centaurea solstitialis]|uniref:Uncharacterized protein n=1 Tax=Centaurea solstitialis TaxID=347529 RepID=A0AA38T467_9ASTR|nr:hypothetical protein OSB04_018113 [Centaurea solstitialis]